MTETSRNPWARLRADLDTIAPEARRLIEGLAWDSARGCGCVFGTIFHEHRGDRGGETKLNFFALATKHGEAWDNSPVAVAFRAWMAERGVTAEMVYDLQQYNDRVGCASPDVRWTRVYAFVAKREAEWVP